MIQYLLIVLVSIAGAEATFYLIHRKKFSVVRASSGASFIFALLTSLISYAGTASLQAAFFGATFVGMTSNARLGEKRVLLASLFFAVIFICVLPAFKGLGGGLGTAAFVSTASVYFIEHAFKVYFNRSK